MNCIGYDDMLQEENEKSPDLTREKRSAGEAGYVSDEIGFYEAGSSERKDKYGDVVSHQDHTSLPRRRER